MDPEVKTLKLYAWVGEDELGSGRVGLKQGLAPAGMVPLVATSREKMGQDYIVAQMQAQALQSGKSISLVAFSFEEVIETLGPGR